MKLTRILGLGLMALAAMGCQSITNGVGSSDAGRYKVVSKSANKTDLTLELSSTLPFGDWKLVSLQDPSVCSTKAPCTLRKSTESDVKKLFVNYPKIAANSKQYCLQNEQVAFCRLETVQHHVAQHVLVLIQPTPRIVLLKKTN